MREKFLLIILLIFNIYIAQETENKISIDSTNIKSINQEERLKNSIPSYNLSKIEKLISKLSSMNGIESNEYNDRYISEKDFDKLTIKEKFTYTMVYPEIKSSSEGMDALAIYEENKIFGELPTSVNDPKWSARQKKFLKQYRKNIQEFIRETSLKNQYMGLNFKKALLEINAIESIPFLVDFYNSTDKNDKDLLTVLMLLVKKGKYYPFVRSNVYRQLYNDDVNSQVSCIDYSDINEEYILKTAHNFYLQAPKIK